MSTKLRSRTTLVLVVIAAAAGVAPGCDFTAFSGYRTGTPVISIPAPDNYPGMGFGTLVASATNDGDRDWLIASGGLGTAVTVTPMRNGTTFPTQNNATYVCSPTMRCNNTTRTGVALEGISGWGGSTACAATGAFGTVHQVHISCFGETPHEFAISPPAAFTEAGFGLAMAAVHKRRESDPSTGDVLFVGAPAGSGHVFAVQPNTVTDFTPTEVPRDAALGSAMAAGVLRASGVVSNLIVAAGAPSIRGVMVFRGDPRAGRAMERIGCMLRDEPGFGGALAIGDVDGDGSEDVIVGGAADVMGRALRVHVYLAAAIPTGTTTCDMTAWPEAAAMDCADVPDRGVRCGGADGLFGSTIAAGDLDRDGRAEIIIGAPRARVDDLAGAGAIWLVRATVRGPNALDLATAGVLRSSNPEANMQLGSSVISPHMGSRDEVVAGAPGSAKAILFLCSGIPGDQPNAGGLDRQCR